MVEAGKEKIEEPGHIYLRLRMATTLWLGRKGVVTKARTMTRIVTEEEQNTGHRWRFKASHHRRYAEAGLALNCAIFWLPTLDLAEWVNC